MVLISLIKLEVILEENMNRTGYSTNFIIHKDPSNSQKEKNWLLKLRLQ